MYAPEEARTIRGFAACQKNTLPRRYQPAAVPSVAALKTACCGCGQLRLMASKSCRRNPDRVGS